MSPSTEVAPVSEYRALTIPESELQGALDAVRQQEVTEFDLTRIKLPAGGGTTWEIPGTRGVERAGTLSAVVVYTKFNRAYWATKFAGGNEPPACASTDGRLATARPVPDPSGNSNEQVTLTIPAEKNEQGYYVCDTCAYSEFGSGTDAKGHPSRSQACRQTRLLFLLLPDRLLPAVVTLPPTSLKVAKTYFLGLIDEGLQTHAVVTEISLEKKSNDQGTFSVVSFKVGEPLSPEQSARAATYAQALKPGFDRVATSAADLPDDIT